MGWRITQTFIRLAGVRQGDTTTTSPCSLPKSFHRRPEGDIKSRGGRFQLLDRLSSKALLSEETNNTADFHELNL